MSIADKLTTIAENEQKVFEAGEKSEYDRFWDTYQENGNRTNYSYAFSGRGWTDETFKPKYDIAISGVVEDIFSMSQISDVAESLNRAGVTLDISKATSITYFMAYNNYTVRVPTLNTTSISDLSYFLYSNGLLKIVDEVVLKSDGSQKFSNYSFRLPALEEIRFSGVIGKNGLNLQWSTNLSHDSIVSIINALSATTSGLTVTLSKTAVNNAFATSEGAGDGSTSQEWLDLIATKSNWTISLV